MGLEFLVTRRTPCQLATLIHRVHSGGLAATIVMVDAELVMPGMTLPAEWNEVRMRTPAGTITLTKKTNGIMVVVFGNADAALRSAQQQVVRALEEKPELPRNLIGPAG